MSPDPFAVKLARKYGRGYHEVRIAINQRVNAGETTYEAVSHIEARLVAGQPPSEPAASVPK